eukprot:102434-Prymnesium_polylepis.1
MKRIKSRRYRQQSAKCRDVSHFLLQWARCLQGISSALSTSIGHKKEDGPSGLAARYAVP